MNLAAIPTFASDDIFHVIVEAPRGSTLKLKYEPRWEAMSVSRPLPAGVSFAFDWGFVPSTEASDGDPLDALLLWDVPSFPGVVVPCRAIGVLQVEQNRRNRDPSERIRNDRVLSVPLDARRELGLTVWRECRRACVRNWRRSRLQQQLWKARTCESSDGATRPPRSRSYGTACSASEAAQTIKVPVMQSGPGVQPRRA